MAKDQLTLQVSPQLQEAMGIRPPQEWVDYFLLLGVSHNNEDPVAVDQAVLERSKLLRQWQASAQFRDEVVRVLGVIHRAAKILRDPARRRIYSEELERQNRGETESVSAAFEALVRAAMADDVLDAAARQKLNEFAQKRGLEAHLAQRIINQVRQEMQAVKASQAVSAKDEWEFRIGGQGEEGFLLTLGGLETAGQMSPAEIEKMVAGAGKYDLSIEQARELASRFQAGAFRRMLARVAGSRAISEAQAMLLLPKAAYYNLTQEKASEIISDFMLSSRSVEDMFERSMETFDQEDIEELVEERSLGKVVRAKRTISFGFPDYLRNIILLGLGGAVLVFAFLWAKSSFFSGDGGQGVIARPLSPEANPPIEPAATAPPSVTPQDVLVKLPDPPGGMVRFDPRQPGDPPAFEMAIAEVSNAEYYEFVKQTLASSPADWVGGRYPEGAETWPVAMVTVQQAREYLRWLASRRGWPVAQVDLPSQAEFLRALRGRTLRGEPSQPGYWDRVIARLGGRAQPANVKSQEWDRIHIPEAGQMYDLIGNVAEWGREEQGSRQAVLGGDFKQSEKSFDPLAARWVAPTAPSPTIGFRFIRRLQP